MNTKLNNRGFTLVELLAVMVILITISLVAVGGITASLTRRDIKECEEQQELAIGAAKIYFSLNNVDTVKVKKLVDDDYLDSDYLVDNGGRLNENDTINLPSGAVEYKYNGNKVGESCS